MIKFLFQIIAVSLVSILLGFSYRFHLPQVEKWILSNIEIYSNENLPVGIRVKGIGFRLLPLAVELQSTQLFPKDSLKESLSNVQIESIQIRPNLTLMLLGKLEIAQVYLDGVKLGFVVKADNKDSSFNFNFEELVKKIDQDSINQTLRDLPVSRFSIHNLEYYGKLEQQSISNMVKDLSFDINRIDEELFVELKAPQFLLKETENSNSLIAISIFSKLVLSTEKIHLTSFRLVQRDSFLDLNFLLSDYLKPEKQSFKLKLNSSLHLPTSTRLLTRFNSKIQLPKLAGWSKTKLELDSNNLNQLKGEFHLDNFAINEYYVGKLDTKLSLSSNHLKLEDTIIQQSENLLYLNNTVFDFPNKSNTQLSFLSFLPNFSNIQFQTDLDLKFLRVEKLLSHLDLKDIPIELDAKSDNMKCVGKLIPNFTTTCTGTAKVEKFRVYTPEEQFTIHSFKNAQLSGSVVINTEGVFPQANLKLQEATGYAKGSVIYSKGFSFDYSSDWFDFSNIENLANLDIKGRIKVNGNTSGDSNHGLIQMNLEADEFSLEKYELGKFQTKLSYKKGILNFNNVTGELPRSRYEANLSVDLLKSSILGSAKSDPFQLHDLSFLVKQQLEIPAELRAQGPLTLNFDGPLEFSKMNYDLKYQSDSLRVSDESFENLYVDLVAKSGSMKSRTLRTAKQDAEISGQIEMSPNLELSGRFNTTDLNIGSFNFSQRLTSKINAQIKAQLDLSGKIPDLKYKWDAELKNFSIGASLLGDSKVSGELDNKKLSSEGDFFDHKLKFSSSLPFDSNSAFFLRMESKDFNFSPLFYLIGINAERAGYRSQLDAKVDLSSAKGGLLNSSGNIDISHLSIERGGLSMRSKNTFSLNAKNGNFNSNPWQLEGDETSLRVQALSSKPKKLNLYAEGELNLALASFLVPFVEDLRGNLQMSVKLLGAVDSPEFAGSAILKNAYFKIPNFNHPFENIRADILLNEKRLIFNKVDARLAGGKLLGNGSIELLGFTNIPTKLSARLTDAKLQLIEGIQLYTAADISLTGSWFPFTLSANARVTKGDIKPNNEQAANSKIRPSRYLPDILLSSSFDPIQLKVHAEILPKVQIITKELVSYTQGKLYIEGPISKMAYTGDLSLVPGGTLYFKDTGFDIRTGNIRFKNDTQFNPELYINGNTSVIEQASNNNYEVEILLQGNLNNFSTKLNSQPNLPENDLISLLALGLTASQLESQTLDNQRDLQMYEIGAAVLSQTPLSKEIKDKTGLDFSLHSDIDETNTTQYKVVISKQVTPKIGASASVLGNNSKKDVKVEYKLNQGLSLIGSWESNTYNENAGSGLDQTQASDIFGLDLRYKVEFK